MKAMTQSRNICLYKKRTAVYDKIEFQKVIMHYQLIPINSSFISHHFIGYADLRPDRQRREVAKANKVLRRGFVRYRSLQSRKCAWQLRYIPRNSCFKIIFIVSNDFPILVSTSSSSATRDKVAHEKGKVLIVARVGIASEVSKRARQGGVGAGGVNPLSSNFRYECGGDVDGSLHFTGSKAVAVRRG